MNTGIHTIPFKEYLALDRISNSYLKRLSVTPASTKQEQITTPAMAFGTACHTYVLEPDKFTDQIAVSPKMDRRTKAGKELYAEFLLESKGKAVISEDEIEAVKSMGGAIKAHPMASKLLSAGVAEQSIIFDLESNDGTAIKCKARPDFLTNEGIVVDLKTTINAGQHGFLRSILQFKYFIQASFYLTGLSKVSDKYERFIFIAIETKPPFRCETYEISPEFIEYGYFKIRDLLEIELRCREDNFWPNYQSGAITMIEKPNYLQYP